LIFLLIKYENSILFVTKKQRPDPEKSINQENFLTELRHKLNDFHVESGRSILEGESYPTRQTVSLMEFINKFSNSISAMLPLPSATLPLPLFKIPPLPFPAKINKPIVK